MIFFVQHKNFRLPRTLRNKDIHPYIVSHSKLHARLIIVIVGLRADALFPFFKIILIVQLLSVSVQDLVDRAGLTVLMYSLNMGKWEIFTAVVLRYSQNKSHLSKQCRTSTISTKDIESSPAWRQPWCSILSYLSRK